MADYVTYKLEFWSTTTSLSHAMKRQHISSSFAGHVPEPSFFPRAPSLLLHTVLDDVKATHRSSTSAAQHKTQANVRQTDEKMEEDR